MWARREQLRPDRWRYVPDGRDDQLQGIRNVRIVWVGTFWNRRDFERISTLVDRLVGFGLVVVDRNEVVNKGRKTRPKTDTETGTSPGSAS